MDQVSSVALNLAHFPDEVWDQIFDFIYAESVVRLWNSGNKAIIRRMQRCTSLDVQLKPRREMIWPKKFLSCFPRLRKLIFGQSDAKWKPFVRGVDLSVLPCDMRVLELNFANGLVCLLQSAPAAPDPTVAFTGANEELQFVDLKVKFPNMERLGYDNEFLDQFMNYNACGFISLVSSLPLAHLSLDVASRVSYGDFSCFPSTLKWLYVDLRHLGEEYDETIQFPPHLTFLHLLGCSTSNVYGLLPSKLRTLIHDFDFGTFIGEDVAKLPKTLTKYEVVTLGHFSIDMAISLPHTLRIFYLQVTTIDHGLEAHLPPCLEDLRINSATFISNDRSLMSIACLPETLTSIQLADALTFPSDQWIQFPRRLTQLGCILTVDNSNEFLSLPPLLTTLKLIVSNEFQFFIMENQSYGFKNLTELHIGDSKETTLSISFFKFVAAHPALVRLKITASFDAAHLDLLNHSLVSLEAKFAAWHMLNLTAPWAARLETLVFSNAVDSMPAMDGAGWLPTASGTGLPPPKKKLAAILASFTDSNHPDNAMIAWFKLLPVTVTHLQPGGVKERSLTAVPGEVLKFLPPNLQKLKIRLETFPADMTQYLPRSLTKLVTFVKKATPLSLNDYIQLPLGLHKLRIPAPDVQDAQMLMPWISQRPMLSSFYFHILSGARFRSISDAVQSRKRGLSLQQLFQETSE